MANFRTWKKQLRVYYDAAHLGSLPCSQQQTYLNNRLDDVLRTLANREAVFSPVPLLMTCICIVDSTFLGS